MAEAPPVLAAALAGRYALEHELGAGGMATVYLAHDLRHERKVALKVLRAELAATLGPERFLQEVRIAANLQHPHILPVHDSGEAGGFLYYVMPFVEGQSLRERLQRGGELPIAEALRILRDVADALSAAHAKGVVHRDIKPENIMLSGRHASVADFGVAKAVSDAAGRQAVTTAGVALGTPTYMAPEQAAADPHVDHRADLYALGVMAYEMLAGQPPFSAPTAQGILAAHLTQAPLPVTQLRATIPPAVAELIMRCLAKKPADRPQSADEVLAVLEGLGTPSGGITPTDTQPMRVRRAGRLSRALYAAGAVTLLALAGGYLWRGRATPTLDADLVAVAPFDVLAHGEELWREGLVDVLSRNLDGAGALRTVTPTVVMRRWQGRADPGSARALGHATGARLVLFGNLVSAGPDTVRVTATLLDAGSGGTLAELELRDLASRMDRLADSLTVRVLRGLGPNRATGTTRVSALGSTSLPAIKLFLRSEQFYRRGAWDSARVYAERALGLDSGFALAMRRISTTQWWLPSDLEGAGISMLREGSHNHGLAPRESLLVTIDSLWGALDAGALRAPLVRRLSNTVEEARRLYPDDPEIWYHKGEIALHIGLFPDWPGPVREVLKPFEQSITLDSTFAPAYLHPIDLLVWMGDTSAALGLTRAYQALGPSGHRARIAELTPALLRSYRDSAAALAAFGTQRDIVLRDLYVLAYGWPDPEERAIALARARLSAARQDPAQRDTLDARAMLSWLLTLRGHPGEALRSMSGDVFTTQKMFGQAFNSEVLGQMSAVRALPPDTLRQLFRLWAERPDPTISIRLDAWAATGDAAGLKQAIATFKHRAEAAKPGSQVRADWTFASVTGGAFLKLAEGDTTAAIHDLLAVPESLCFGCTRYGLAPLLLARGDYKTADSLLALELHAADFVGTTDVFWSLLRGRVHEHFGRRAQAVDAYQRVVDYWRHAEPVLQPYVAEAKDGLSRLRSDR